MAYEPTGLRVKLEESTETKLFVWDDQRYLIEADGFGDTIAWYTVEPTEYGRIISKQQGYRRYFHFDGLGSTRVITQANENVNNRYTYDAWGNLVDSFGTNPNPFRFVGEQGYYTDVETEVNYIRERIYEPLIARWWSADPIGFVDTLNLFIYVSNRPMAYTDPSGMSLYTGGFCPQCPQTYDAQPLLYGCYCGPEHPNVLFRPLNQPPIDPIDNCCKAHDECYERHGCMPGIQLFPPGIVFDPNPNCQRCDKDLCRCLKLATCNRYSGSADELRTCTDYRAGAMGIFRCRQRFGIHLR